MTHTLSPLLILVALVALAPWKAIGCWLRSLVFKARLARVVARLRRPWPPRPGACGSLRGPVTMLVYTGVLERADTFALVRRIRAADPHLPLVLVLDTTGGDMSAGLQLLHALSSHPSRVVVRVADECWSAGTLAALGADEIILAPDANLGFCDAIAHTEPGKIHTGPVMTSVTRGEPVDVVRSRHVLRDITRSVTAARVARGDAPADACALAERMVSSDCDHWQPIFIEEARSLGLPVKVDADPIWYEVVRLSIWARR
jgi:membrane-bound ClpP family serine protease